MPPKTDPTQRFECSTDLLGHGAYKAVYKAFDNEEGVEVAWNELKMHNISETNAEKILAECRILQSLNNNYIIKSFHSWKTKENDGLGVYFITELMSSGTLNSFIKRSTEPIKPKIYKHWCRQILKGLLYLHTREPKVIHRDLKCDNVFINGNSGHVKIGDLGLAIQSDSDHNMHSVLGTPNFMAPELYEEVYDEKVDIYAFGLCLLEIITKEYPYSECENSAQIFMKVSQGIPPNSFKTLEDKKAADFIRLCIAINPKDRPSAQELLNHEFLALAPNFDTIVSCTVSILDYDMENIEFKMLLHDNVKPNKQEVKFTFNLDQDTVDTVVNEMVEECVLPASARELVLAKIYEGLGEYHELIKLNRAHSVDISLHLEKDDDEVVSDHSGTKSDGLVLEQDVHASISLELHEKATQVTPIKNFSSDVELIQGASKFTEEVSLSVKPEMKETGTEYDESHKFEKENSELDAKTQGFTEKSPESEEVSPEIEDPRPLHSIKSVDSLLMPKSSDNSLYSNTSLNLSSPDVRHRPRAKTVSDEDVRRSMVTRSNSVGSHFIHTPEMKALIKKQKEEFEILQKCHEDERLVLQKEISRKMSPPLEVSHTESERKTSPTRLKMEKEKQKQGHKISHLTSSISLGTLPDSSLHVQVPNRNVCSVLPPAPKNADCRKVSSASVDGSDVRVKFTHTKTNQTIHSITELDRTAQIENEIQERQRKEIESFVSSTIGIKNVKSVFSSPQKSIPEQKTQSETGRRKADKDLLGLDPLL